MFPEQLALKKTLADALESVAGSLRERVSMYALLETEDPAFPFELKWVHKPGETGADDGLILQRLFDNAFLAYGFREVRTEENIEGVLYKPLEDMLADPGCIGVTEVSFFAEDESRARMTHGIEEAPEDENPAAMRIVAYLNLVKGRVLAGEPAERLGYEDVPNVRGLVFKFDCPIEGGVSPVIAFQRTQPMWVSKKSNYLLFGREGSFEMFADRSLKIGTSFDFLQYDGMLMFANMKVLDTLFSYHAFIAQQAKDYADTLDAIIADYEKLDERIATSRAVANKLLKIRESKSPVAELDADELEYRVNRIAYYNSKLKFNEEGKLLMLNNTDVSDFLKMLGDDFLVSPLSQAQYETRSKKRLDKPHDAE